jgi:hypothetical protein
MNPIDTQNPAVAKFDECPPKLIEEIYDDPENAAKLYRTMAVITDYELYTMREALTPAQRMEASANWRKAGGLYGKKDAQGPAGGGVSITINLPSRKEPLVIDAESVQTLENDA